MIVIDLSKSFHPVPKPKDKVEKRKQASSKKDDLESNTLEGFVSDFCIMPNSTKYSTKRTKKYCERHEVFFSKAYRNKSIKDGLIVFLTEEDHRGTEGAHGKNGNKFNRYLKKVAKSAWMKYYKKTKEDFIKRYGKNYIDKK